MAAVGQVVVAAVGQAWVVGDPLLVVGQACADFSHVQAVVGVAPPTVSGSVVSWLWLHLSVP